MAWTTDSSGTQTAVISTEHVLDTPNTVGTYKFKVDTVNLANGDVLELRIYEQIDGTNYRQCWKGTYQHAQLNTGKISPVHETSGNTLKFTLKQTAGTGRSFPWQVIRI